MSKALPVQEILKFKVFTKQIAEKYGSDKRKVGFQFWNANLVFAFIGVRQAQTFGCACLKRKCRQYTVDSRQ